MAFPNTTPFSWNPRIEISDEEYKLFHQIDRELLSTLIHTLRRDSFDAISVVSFLLWLERNMLGSKAVEKVNRDWPNHLIDMLADQVVALLQWLKNPTLVWEMRGDISLIQELCSPDVGFVYLHHRRLQILKEKTEIVHEMAEKAFKDMFPGGVVDRSVDEGVGQGSNGGAVNVPREIEKSFFSVQVGSGSGYGHGPRVPESNVGGELTAGVPVYGDVGQGSSGGAVNVPREIEKSFFSVHVGSGSGYGHSPRVPESNVGREFAAEVPVHGLPELRSYNHDGAGFEIRGRYVGDPRELRNVNHNVGGYGSTAAGLIHGRLLHDIREAENQNIGVRLAARSVRNPPELPNNIYNGVGYQTDPRVIYVPRQLNRVNHPGLGYATAGGLVQVHREPINMPGGGAAGVFGTIGGLLQLYREAENMNGDDSDDEQIPDDDLILPNIPFGPRMGYVETDGGNPGNSRRSEMVHTRRPYTEDELSMLLSGLNVREEETGVHDDDKTVFLTFSRGYPITEPEIWGFFTRRFGNFIKAIHFEEVQEGVQALYARMVAQNCSVLPLICGVNVRTKYVINGKHVWAKKYVRKHHTPPPRLSSSTADPPPSP
ncbi:hypothetical protein POM88_006222 [Heracleum sosnowskyi]|uniref:Uncharacterized protein n=1 Tax=Heracleum sosnowskyi TaxID=360622 RepID=A0AAD8J3X4_9APIA|nr:hypothetical protein POM88_006222 [Heracleum sosnowskyi]